LLSFLFISWMHAGSFCDSTEPQITESQGQPRPHQACPCVWDSPLCNPRGVRLGIVDKRPQRSWQGKSTPGSLDVHPGVPAFLKQDLFLCIHPITQNSPY
jgi:hypothetical protein